MTVDEEEGEEEEDRYSWYLFGNTPAERSSNKL